jgi:hypothetical protein
LWGCPQDAQEYRNQKGVQTHSHQEKLSLIQGNIIHYYRPSFPKAPISSPYISNNPVNARAIVTKEVNQGQQRPNLPAKTLRTHQEVKVHRGVKIKVKDFQLFFHPRPENLYHLSQADQPVHH